MVALWALPLVLMCVAAAVEKAKTMYAEQQVPLPAVPDVAQTVLRRPDAPTKDAPHPVWVSSLHVPLPVSEIRCSS